MSTKQELEQQLADTISLAQRLGAENKQLKQINDDLTSSNNKLIEEFNLAADRIRYLANQVNMLEMQNKARTQFSDNDRNY